MLRQKDGSSPPPARPAAWKTGPLKPSQGEKENPLRRQSSNDGRDNTNQKKSKLDSTSSDDDMEEDPSDSEKTLDPTSQKHQSTDQ